MEFQHLVRTRRMVRRFEPRPVPRDVLLRVLEVARHAPSAGFSQGFDFVVLDEPGQVRWFIDMTNHPQFPWEPGEMDEPPPCFVLAISNTPAYLERYSRPDKERFGLQTAEAWPVPYWDVDTGMAVMLVLLAAVEEGLGAWLFGIFWGEQEMLRELGVPEGCRPIGVIGLGSPAATDDFDPSRFARRRRSLDSMVHFGRWRPE
jgi:nitroreductase